jgi:hypothetical protein
MVCRRTRRPPYFTLTTAKHRLLYPLKSRLQDYRPIAGGSPPAAYPLLYALTRVACGSCVQERRFLGRDFDTQHPEYKELRREMPDLGFGPIALAEGSNVGYSSKVAS